VKIAIQGIRGSFHHIVAESYFDEGMDLVECLSFSEIPELIVTGKADAGVMAIENSIAGAILPNYALIEEYDLVITGEYYLTIHQHLMALEGQSIDDIKEVLSHPMALLQCRRFLNKHPHLKLIEDKDTAEVARRIQEEKLKGVAAIAPKLAAEMYGLEMIGKSIETYKKNYTRFLVLDRAESPVNKEFDKVSLCFTLPHVVGSLHQVLAALALCKTNLTKIQSAPLLDSEFEYLFFVDFLLDENKDFESIINVIKKHTLELRILGTYKKGNKHEH